MIKDWELEKQEKLIDAFELSQILKGLIFVNELDFYKGFGELIKISEHAAEIISKDNDLSNTPDIALSIAAFTSFYHHELLFDLEKFEVQALCEYLSSLIKNKHVLLPQRFGRRLYDKYSDLFPYDRRDSLTPEETERLLLNEEQGVFQAGNFLLGPLGLIISRGLRYAPPTRSIPLWHCENMGCNHLHDVLLSDKNNIIPHSFNKINYAANNTHGLPSHWTSAILIDRDIHYPLEYHDIISITQECFSVSEIRIIFRDLLTSSQSKSDMWDEINSMPKGNYKSKDPTELSLNLSQNTLVQLILACSDDDIVKAIDRTILSKRIIVPAAEKRVAKQTPPSINYGESSSSISSLGIRSDSNNPLSRLSTEIWIAYRKADRLADLSWRTMRSAGPASPGAVLDYLKQHSPSQAVSELILSSREVSQDVTEALFIESTDGLDEAHLVAQILWKIGLDAPRFGDEFSTITRNLDSFKLTLLSCEDPLTTADRERIRASGVNLFVHLEWFIETFISYNVWLLQNDHLEHSFIYRPEDSLKIVGETLPTQEISSWKITGGNTLGVLISYLSASVEWMKQLLATEANSIPNRTQYPHYVPSSSQLFPFHKPPLWANSDHDELEKFVKSFTDVANLILRSGLPGVRNGLEHFRRPEEFPELDVIIACEVWMRQAFEIADAKRLAPKRWWLKERKISDFGQVIERFEDERARPLELNYPSSLVGVPDADFGEAITIPHGNLLGHTNSDLVFKVIEKSEYTALWANYPYRPPTAM
ncbi:hypothetical protein [Sphingomonas trueperi]|uniref:hypothetical protein n=1 Tax=Sphingomonas trueperi TaxID=53317 RepID=UPI0011C47DBF